MSSSASGPSYIPLGTKSKCSMGTSEERLNLPLDHGVAYSPSLKPLLNANDHIPGEHILKYGYCKSMRWLCSPVTPLAWINVNKKHLIDGAPALTENSLLPCVKGGVISIVPINAGSASIGDRNEDAADTVEPIAIGLEGVNPAAVMAFWDKAKELLKPQAAEIYKKHEEDFKSGKIDYAYVELSPGEKLLAPTGQLIVDRYGQIYIAGGATAGAGVGIVEVGAMKIASNHGKPLEKDKMRGYIEGFSGTVAASGGIGGLVTVGAQGPSVGMSAGAMGGNLSFTYTGKIYDLFPEVNDENE